MVGVAQTGSGKTLGVSIVLFWYILLKVQYLRYL